MLKKKKKKPLLNNSELSAFCTQMAMILKSGIPAQEGVGIMREDAENSYTAEILDKIFECCDLGMSFSQSLSEAGVFPKYMLDMIVIGEESGKLDDVLLSLGDYYEREENISGSIKSAVTYPLVMIVMMLLVIGVLVIKVLPVFNDVFAQLGGELSGFAQTVMNMGVSLSRYSIIFVIALCVIIVAVIIFGNTSRGKRGMQRFKAKFFLTRKLYAKIAAGRFANGMSLMLGSGLDTDESLAMAAKLVDNDITAAKIERCRAKIAEGESFYKALAESEIFSSVYSHMIAVGIKTGSTDEMMRKVAQRYEKEINDKLNSVISILEPSLVAVLSVIVGMILLSVMLPLMGIMTTLA